MERYTEIKDESDLGCDSLVSPDLSEGLSKSLKYSFTLSCQSVLVLEISSSLQNQYYTTSLRELLNHIRCECEYIDKEREGETCSKPRLSNSLRLRGRDFRHLEESLRSTISDPGILIRRHLVLISMDPMRAIVTSNKIFLVIPDGADNVLYILEQSLHTWERDTSDKESDNGYESFSKVPFELRAYEAIFYTLVAAKKLEYSKLQRGIESAIMSFTNSSGELVSIEAQVERRALQQRLLRLQQSVEADTRVLAELLENDEDLALMSLSALHAQPALYERPLKEDLLRRRRDVEVRS